MGLERPVAERGEPQIPIETGLIGGVDAGSFVWILGLKPKFVGQPILAVIGALEFDFVAAAGHYREEAVAVGDAKGCSAGDGSGWNGTPGQIIHRRSTVLE